MISLTKEKLQMRKRNYYTDAGLKLFYSNRLISGFIFF